MFVCGVVWFQPRVTQTYESMGLASPEFNLRLAELGRTAPTWARGYRWPRSGAGVVVAMVEAGDDPFVALVAIYTDEPACVLQPAGDVCRLVGPVDRARHPDERGHGASWRCLR